MSEFDAGLYNDLSSVVSQQVAALRVIIEGLEVRKGCTLSSVSLLLLEFACS